MIVIPDVADVELLELLTDSLTAWVHLYREDVPLERGTTLTDLVQLDVPGYAPVLATAWSDPEIVARRAQTTASPILFTRGTGTPLRDVYGYYVTQGVSGPLLWVERGIAPPYPMRISTDQILVTPRLSLRAEKRRLRTGL